MRYDKYEKKGACHWRQYTRDKSYRGLVEASILPFIPVPRGTLIDIGCGDGVPTCKLAEINFDVTGVEIEPAGIEWAKKKCSNQLEWVCQSAEGFYEACVKNGRKFDYLYSLDVIEHLKDPKIMVKMMDLVNQFAVIITDDKDKMTIKEPNPYHNEEFTRDEFKKLFKDYWLEEVPLLDERFFGFKISKKV